jgi:hypothetical protein
MHRGHRLPEDHHNRVQAPFPDGGVEEVSELLHLYVIDGLIVSPDGIFGKAWFK